MAYLHPNAVPQLGFDLFNVDFNVGRGGFNIRVDVMLVQAITNMFYISLEGDGGPTLGKFELPDGDPGGRLPVDGKMSPVLIARILQFQNEMARKSPDGPSVFHVDAVFDPYRPNAARSLRTHSRYTFLQLNGTCLRTALAIGVPAIYTSIRNDPRRDDIPAELRNALQRTKSIASQHLMPGQSPSRA